MSQEKGRRGSRSDGVVDERERNKKGSNLERRRKKKDGP